MNETCIIVADAKCARFFALEAPAAGRAAVRVVERSALVNPDVEGVRKGGAERIKSERLSNRQAGDTHPIAERRERHRLELDRRFGRHIAQQAAAVVHSWDAGTVVLIADPHMLGLVRKGMREALKPGIELKELARDYAHLTPEELQDHLATRKLIPATLNGG